jgi:hypothetical protein
VWYNYGIRTAKGSETRTIIRNKVRDYQKKGTALTKVSNDSSRATRTQEFLEDCTS